MKPFKNSEQTAETLLERAKKVVNCKTLSEAEIEFYSMTEYAEGAQCMENDRRYGLASFPFEPGPCLAGFVGGVF